MKEIFKYLSVMIIVVFILLGYLHKSWSPYVEPNDLGNTYYQTYTIDEAISTLGTDLLLANFIELPIQPHSILQSYIADHYGNKVLNFLNFESPNKPYVKIELFLEEGGELTDRNSWKYLSAQMNYSGHRFGSSIDEIDYPEIVYHIYFNPSFIPPLPYETFTESEVNDITLRYMEYGDNSSPYQLFLCFEHNSWFCTIKCKYMDSELCWLTINQILES